MQDCLLPTYNVLTDSQIQKINENSFLLKYKKSDIICQTDHPISHVLFLKSGLIKLYKNYSQDKSTIVGIIGQERFFGAATFLSTKVFQFSVSALEDSEVIHTNINIFIDILFKNGKYACQIMRQINGYSLMLIDKMIMNVYLHIPGRMAYILLFFSKEVYKNNTFILPLSRLEIAEFISATKETVSRTLTEFKNDRLIEINGNKVTIKTPDLIEKLSNLG